MDTAQTTDPRVARLMARTTTAALITALQTLDAMTDAEHTRETRRARAWTIDELERRHPAASDAVEAAYLAHELQLMAGEDAPEPSYADVLIGAILRPNS